ncbi:hypothetical protein [Pseudomonas kurunegalensis]|nr:hypothetical protein [Pseudomonas kurunegalensis]
MEIGKKLVRDYSDALGSLCYQGVTKNYAQSIIGTTLNRRNGSAH